MKPDLPCDLIRDLLPSYVDGLTSAASNAAVESHVAACPGCAERLAAMRADAPEAADAPQIDYLKKVRRRSRTAVWIAAACILLAALLCIPLFRTEAVSANLLSYHLEVQDRSVTLYGTLPQSVGRFAGVDFFEEDGVLEITVRASRGRIYGKSEFVASCVADEEITQIRMGGLTLWENGTPVARAAALAFAAKTPYVGDITADLRAAEAIGVYEQFGSFKNSLWTGAEPYNWTLTLDEPVAADDLAYARKLMRADACALLALIDNLGEVTWEFTSDAGPETLTVTLADASAVAGKDIKACAQSASELETLLRRVGLIGAGVKSQDGDAFGLLFRNATGKDVYEWRIELSRNGALFSSGGAINADSSPYRDGDTMLFRMESAHFPIIAGGAPATFQFDITALDADGRVIASAKNVSLSPRWGMDYRYALTPLGLTAEE